MRRRSFSRWTVRIKIAAPALIAIWLAFGAVGSRAAAPARFDAVPAFGHVFLVVG
jgi:hypothetical protein